MQSNSSGRSGKAPRRKQSEEFPLRVHKGTGYWCKKVRGHVWYFGRITDDPKGEAALDQWGREKDDILAGREPGTSAEGKPGCNLDALSVKFLEHHEARRDNCEIHPRTFAELVQTCKIVCKILGRHRSLDSLVPDDFRKLRVKLAKGRGAVSLNNHMMRCRSLFKFAAVERLIDRPVHYGAAFDRVRRDIIEKGREQKREKHGDRMLEAAEIRKILATCTQPLKAMILLGCNCAYGNSDLANLPIKAINFESGWVDFARVKTGVRRHTPLWPETISAVREWLTMRPAPKHVEDSDLLFLTRCGARWVKVSANGSPDDAISKEFSKLLTTLDLKRPGVNFYSLRHGFETVGGEHGDQIAVDRLMGHTDRSMASHYRERFSEARLHRVTDHIRDWLFHDSTPAPKADVTTEETEGDEPENTPADRGERPPLRLYSA
jgi:integrase